MSLLKTLLFAEKIC